MKNLKFLAVPLIAAAVMALSLGSAYAKTSPPSKGAKYVNGTLCSYVAKKSATIAAPNSTCTGTVIAIKLNKHTKLVDESTPASAPAAGDAAAAFLQWRKGRSVATKLEYGTSAFIFRHALSSGTYVSFSGTCPDGVLTIKTLGKKHMDKSFNADANTAWEQHNQTSTCATATLGLKAKDRLNVTGGQLTDDSWHANMVNVNPS